MVTDRKKQPTTKLDYRLPALWDCWEYAGQRRRLGREVVVRPAEYAVAGLTWIVEHSEADDDCYVGTSLSRMRGVRRQPGGKVKDGARNRPAGDWIVGQSMYGMMVRATTAWDHDGDSRLTSRRYSELGTFLKSALLLPLLKHMGVSVIYTMPVIKVSNAFRKGELGCPYAARSFFELDPHQRDGLLHDVDAEGQFGVFVECAHRLGMRVMIDVAPRTGARDHDWILDHPDWFYWIDKRFARSYRAPKLPGIDYVNPIPGRLNEIYDNAEVRTHLKKFRFAPSVTEPQKWANFVKRTKAKPPADLLAEISKHFGVITPPGFSDVINDAQPPWSDVTYLRLFLDHPAESANQLPDPKRQPPYVLFDTAKASLFEGKKPNLPLWKSLANIIPFYQAFGVDGARVDMAHALPHRLERMILDQARKHDPDFCFLAEDLGTQNHAKLRKTGYNINIGPSWWMQPRGHQGFMHKLLDELPRLKIPVMAAAETPDTPRAAIRNGKRKFSKQAVVVNNFLPNAVPMINGGMEVFERQPMNLGLDIVRPGRDALPKSDPQAGKLAFFDRYALHWTNPGGKQMIDLIARASALRSKHIKAITSKRAYFQPRVATNIKWILATGFSLGAKKGSLLMLANLDYTKARRTTVSGIKNRRRDVEVLLEINESPAPKMARAKLSLTLPPGDVKILCV